MANTTLSGYLAAAQSGLTTQMNGLSDNVFSALGNSIDNSTTKYMLCDVQIDLASFTAGTTGDEVIEIYLVPSVDGTNDPDWATGSADAQQNNSLFVGSVPISQGAGAKRAVLRNVALANGSFKWAVRNRANATLAGSGNTLTWRPHSYGDGA